MPQPAVTQDLFRPLWATQAPDAGPARRVIGVLLVSGAPSLGPRLTAQLAGPGPEVFGVHAVAGWHSALEYLHDHSVGAVLLDAQNLDVDPKQAVSLLRRVARDVPSFTLVHDAHSEGLPHALPMNQLDRGTLLQRLRAWSKRRASTPEASALALSVPLHATAAAHSPERDAQDLLRHFDTEGAPAGLGVQMEPVVCPKLERAVAWRATLAYNPAAGPALGPQALWAGARAQGHSRTLWQWALAQACAEPRGRSLFMPLELHSGPHADFMAELVEILEAQSLAPQDLFVEWTEREVVAHPGAAVEWAHELRLLGVQVGLTEVGAGPSNLSVLARLRPAYLEVCAALSGRAHVCRDSADAVAAICAVAESLGGFGAAADISGDVQADRLQCLGCARLRGAWWDQREAT